MDATDLITDYLEQLRQAGAPRSTIDGRRKTLLLLHRTLPYGLARTCEDELREWLAAERVNANGEPEPKFKANTKATYYRTMRSFYRWATDPRDPWLTHDPTIGLPVYRSVPGVANPCTDEQLACILADADQPFRLWAVIAAYQGLRCVEISRLDREHVTEQRLVVVLGKGGRPRVHDTDEYVWRAVRDFPPGPIAVWRGRRATPHEVSRESAAHFQHHLGLAGVSMHRLRHWLGVTTQREYRDVRVTQAVLGHASLASTQIYTDATAEQQRAARAMLPRLAG